MKCNEKKQEQLGMALGTASGRLKKKIMFNLLEKLNMNICFQCGEKITKMSELSIDHKIPWLDSKNPKDLFFNLENIAFSHLNCNTRAGRRYNKGNLKHPSQAAYSKGCRCLEYKNLQKLRMRNYRENK